jgi:ubiquinone/menaquinone biosynthesis C-methylase UbiE
MRANSPSLGGFQKPKWPKTLPPLTESQQHISDDFVKVWHQTLPRYNFIERFNHGWVASHAPTGFRRTLEIGAGLGEHLRYEKLATHQEAGYVSLELRENMVAEIRKRFPGIQTVLGDCQKTLPFSEGYFDRILAIHVLEHLPDLPATIREMHRLCDKQRGVFQVVIPCEGGAFYSLCRRISAQRIFERRYGQPYAWFIEREHINLPGEIAEEIRPYFTLHRRSFFPFVLPGVSHNLCIAMNLTPKAAVGG